MNTYIYLLLSEAYLEGMKTWCSSTNSKQKKASEAYLEGMKTCCAHIFHQKVLRSEAYLEGMKTYTKVYRRLYTC